MSDERTIAEIQQENARLRRMVYPYIGISDHNQIILFTAPRAGININGNGWPVGYQSDGWDEKSFVPYYGQITIVNGKVKTSDNDERSKAKWENTKPEGATE